MTDEPKPDGADDGEGRDPFADDFGDMADALDRAADAFDNAASTVVESARAGAAAALDPGRVPSPGWPDGFEDGFPASVPVAPRKSADDLHDHFETGGGATGENADDDLLLTLAQHFRDTGAEMGKDDLAALGGMLEDRKGAGLVPNPISGQGSDEPEGMTWDDFKKRFGADGTSSTQPNGGNPNNQRTAPEALTADIDDPDLIGRVMGDRIAEAVAAALRDVLDKALGAGGQPGLPVAPLALTPDEQPAGDPAQPKKPPAPRQKSSLRNWWEKTGIGRRAARYKSAIEDIGKRLGGGRKRRRAGGGKTPGPGGGTGAGGGRPPQLPPPTGSAAAGPSSAPGPTSVGGRASVAAAGEGAMVGAGRGLVAVAGPLAIVAAAAVGAAVALYKAAEAGVKLAYSQEAAARQNEVSADLAAINQRLTYARQQRDVLSGAVQAPSYDKLADAIDRMEETIRPIEDGVAELKNIIATGVVNTLTEMAQTAIEIAKSIPGVAEKLKELADERAAREAKANQQGFGGFLEREEARMRADQAAGQQRLNAARQINQNRGGLG